MEIFMKLLFLPLALVFASVSAGAIGYVYTKFLDWTISFDNQNLEDAVYMAGLPMFVIMIGSALFGTIYLIFLAFS